MKALPKKQPTLTSKRLILRAPSIVDIPQLTKLANNKNISTMLAGMPHPYITEDAEAFIEKTNQKYQQQKSVQYAIIDAKTQQLIGVVGFSISHVHNHVTLGYWLGEKYWGEGFMSEACATLMEYAFMHLNVYRVASHHFHTNPASGKVMKKIGLLYEGKRLGHFKKGKEYLDICDYGLLASAYKEGAKSSL